MMHSWGHSSLCLKEGMREKRQDGRSAMWTTKQIFYFFWEKAGEASK